MLLWLLWGDDVTRIVLHAEDLLFQMCCWAFTMTAEVNTHPACLKLKPRGPINLLLKSVERLAAVGAGLRKKSLLRLKSEWEYHEILGSCPAPVLAVVHCWLVCALCLRCLALFLWTIILALWNVTFWKLLLAQALQVCEWPCFICAFLMMFWKKR